MGRKWTPEQKAAVSAKAKARWQASGQTRIGGKVGTDVPLQADAPTMSAEDEFREARAAAEIARANAPETGEPHPDAAMPEPDPDKPETIPPNYMSGQVRRLEDHSPRKGWVRYWQNDDKGGSSIAYMLKTGWKFVDRKDAQLNAAVTPRNNDLGSRVRQVVGTDEGGQPMYAYLMEKPEWLHELHSTGPGSREEYHRNLEKQIGAGIMNEKPGENRYSAGKPFRGLPTALPAISMDTSIKTHR